MSNREMIEFWKNNEKPFGLCPEECREWLENAKIQREHFDGFNWIPSCFTGVFDRLLVYRIPADYQPEKQGRWVECEVETECGSYWFYWAATRYRLSVAPGMVGFGGVRYEGEEGWHGRPEWVGRKEVKPTPPVSVRFWVEE